MEGEHLKSMMKQGSRARVLAVASGKGGVGKTNISANLAVCLAAAGRKVTLVDADISLGNLDVVMGVESRYNISHLLDGTRSLREIINVGPCGVELLCGASGAESLAELDEFRRRRLLDELDGLAEESDVLIVDCAAGIGKCVSAFCMAADHVLVVATPEPASMTDAYAVIKMLAVRKFRGRISIVVNMAADSAEGRRTARQIARVARQFLNIHVYEAAVLLRDEQLWRAVRKRTPVALACPRARITSALTAMAARLARIPAVTKTEGGFFRRVAGWFM